MDTLRSFPAKVNTEPLSRQEWLEQAAAAVRWLRKNSKPSSDEQDERYAEDRLRDAAGVISAAIENMPRQLIVTVHAEGESGSVRILDQDTRAFIVELPARVPTTPPGPRRWSPLELAEALDEELEG